MAAVGSLLASIGSKWLPFGSLLHPFGVKVPGNIIFYALCNGVKYSTNPCVKWTWPRPGGLFLVKKNGPWAVRMPLYHINLKNKFFFCGIRVDFVGVEGAKARPAVYGLSNVELFPTLPGAYLSNVGNGQPQLAPF